MAVTRGSIKFIIIACNVTPLIRQVAANIFKETYSKCDVCGAMHVALVLTIDFAMLNFSNNYTKPCVDRSGLQYDHAAIFYKWPHGTRHLLLRLIYPTLYH